MSMIEQMNCLMFVGLTSAVQRDGFVHCMLSHEPCNLPSFYVVAEWHLLVVLQFVEEQVFFFVKTTTKHKNAPVAKHKETTTEKCGPLPIFITRYHTIHNFQRER